MDRRNGGGEGGFGVIGKVVAIELGMVSQGHRDRCVRYSHELSDDAAECASRVLIRFVPMVYGVVLGTLAEHPFVGLSLGLLVSAALDLKMGPNSLVRPLVAPAFERLCPRIALAVAATVDWSRRHGVPVPKDPYQLPCGTGRP
jgi:hypothetical protein